jgi:hypothetical protein
VIGESMDQTVSLHHFPHTAVSLGEARPGARYRVISITFPIVREYLARLGIGVGDEVSCEGNGVFVVRISKDGREVDLGNGCGWFVQVMPLADATVNPK